MGRLHERCHSCSPACALQAAAAASGADSQLAEQPRCGRDGMHSNQALPQGTAMHGGAAVKHRCAGVSGRVVARVVALPVGCSTA
jgi:hypothetical protein